MNSIHLSRRKCNLVNSLAKRMVYVITHVQFKNLNSHGISRISSKFVVLDFGAVSVICWSKRSTAEHTNTKSKLTEHKLLNELSIRRFQFLKIFTWTSSSFLTGMDRTLYFCRNSLDRGADINLRRICDGAVKCAFRLFRLEAVTNLFNFMIVPSYLSI